MGSQQSLYARLDPSSCQIRLVHIQPGVWDDPILCELETVSLDSSPVYQTLSYFWGDPKDSKPILLEDCVFDVTSNLYDALRRLRRTNSIRVIWIDAICINQMDNDEKAQQVMLMKSIDDIRLLRSSDPRVARQMLNLDPYEPVSNQPAISRDMSICVADPDMELLGDRIRDALGERGGWVENVERLQASDYASVPEAARWRLGMLPGQQNLLIRVTLRPLDGSISKEEANRVYDLVYAKLHEGTAGYFR